MKLRLLLIVCILLVILIIAWLSGIRINRSESLPGLLWRLEPLENAETLKLQHGQAVFICPPDTGIFRLAKERGYVPFGLSCPNYYAPVLKPVAAIPSDHIHISPQGIRINGELQENSKRLNVDGQGRNMPILPEQEYKLRAGEFWLLSEHHPRSFDSRYFGPIAQQHIIGRAVAVTAPW